MARTARTAKLILVVALKGHPVTSTTTNFITGLTYSVAYADKRKAFNFSTALVRNPYSSFISTFIGLCFHYFSSFLHSFLFCYIYCLEVQNKKERNSQRQVYSSFATSKGRPDRYETCRKITENPPIEMKQKQRFWTGIGLSGLF